jgi:type I restriction enzyme S subunit
MNAERLLEHYDRIADAPDAIARLRRFILDLAVRGKLVPQDPNDEPASELLKRIAKEKARLVKAGEIRKQETFDPVSNADVMFPVPKNWERVPATFPAFVVSDMDKKVQTKDVLESGNFPVVDQGKVFIRGYCNDSSKVIRVKAPLILFGDHTRETKLIDFDFVVGADGVKLLQPVCLFTNYYFLALQWLPLDSRGYGRHFKLLRASYLPLPPLAEQRRIVAKVDELMALCDRLEAARGEREATRDRLAVASLARLNAPDPATFQDDTRFALDTLQALTTRPDQIKPLRQTILNLAVRGKLVPQDPNDEPASELLKRIAKEKARLGIKA